MKSTFFFLVPSFFVSLILVFFLGSLLQESESKAKRSQGRQKGGTNVVASYVICEWDESLETLLDLCITDRTRAAAPMFLFFSSFSFFIRTVMDPARCYVGVRVACW